MTFARHILVNFVFVVVGVLRGIELLGAGARWAVLNSGRLGLYLLITLTALKGFYMESSASAGLTNLPQVFSPSGSVLGIANSVLKIPAIVNPVILPEISAKAVLAKDVKTGTTLLEINLHEKLAPASTTKLMTAVAALDLYSLEEVVKVPEFCTTIEGQKTGFYADDSYIVRDLVSSLLINSSADAACALSLGKVSYTQFIDLMNEKATTLGLKDTHVTNPVGLDSANGDHVSTAEDLYKLAILAVKDPLIAESVRTRQKTITSLEGNSFEISNTNALLWSLPGTVGIKTGTTQAAGEVLIYQYDQNDHNIVIVVMGSKDRFTDTRNILSWILQSYGWVL